MFDIIYKIFVGLVILDAIAFALLVAGWPIWLRIIANTEWFDDRCEEFEDGMDAIKEKFEKFLKKA